MPLTCTAGKPTKTTNGEIEVEAIDPAYIFSPSGKAYLITGGGVNSWNRSESRKLSTAIWKLVLNR